ncbi:S1C family serine protease [Phytoactinopolyspora halotolerans]|uniref:PDZ domain-containing protein n=1 Tax=Phytoactinopolyspora halotolerans TaxID=1981512 RepID=A0A6L9SEQ7_9ACTN|nr:trypsin-like peptidase domain-containing protein [Phytoactinopolyspora halotolerans]NEE03559.1 PDZ domain-containing protein [Phytoactinopolyspora halotolerans]
MFRTAAGSRTPHAPQGGIHPDRQRWLTASTLTGVLLVSTVTAGAAAAATTDDAEAPAATVTARPDASPERGLPFGRGGFDSHRGSYDTGTGSLDVTEATDEQEDGVVIIETVNGYSSSASAGTGIVLTEDGLVLTNNHVIAGSTEVKVTVPTTGETYDATVVGSDATSDIAVLELGEAAGLTVADLDDDGDPNVGDAVTGVGNAYGQGELVAAEGTVTALDQTITTAGSYGVPGETLESLIEIDADIVSGDSGGPLLDEEGEVVGVNTAASERGRIPAHHAGTTDITAYAVPIDDAMEIVDTILDGAETDTVTIGYPAFLGVQLTSSGNGSIVAGVIAGTPAADAGLRAGDTITAVDGTTVTTGEEMRQALDAYQPGDAVTITWTDAAGQTHTATVALAQGPAA